MSVLVATAYMEEAERFDWLVAMNGGQFWRPARRPSSKPRRDAARSRTPSSRFLPGAERQDSPRCASRRAASSMTEPVIAARDLTRRFGDFTAVDHVSFTIERGEIFGFVGSEWLRQDARP